MTLNLVKKISISTLILASSFTAVSLSSHPVFADTDQFDIPARASNSDGTPAWSVNEMIAINYKMESEREAKCGNDAVCRDQLYIEQQSRGGISHTLLGYNNKSFLITAVYPDQNRIKVVFHGDDQWLKAIGFNYGTPIEEIIIAWFEDPTRIYNNGEWADAIVRGDPYKGTHLLYAKNLHGGYDWTDEPTETGEFHFPTDEEFEILVNNPNNDLTRNITRKIHFRAFGYARNNIINNSDHYDYSACYNSPDYSPEIGCHLFYDENHRFFYLPYEVLPTDDYYIYIDSNNNNSGDDTVTTTSDTTNSEDNNIGDSIIITPSATGDTPVVENTNASSSVSSNESSLATQSSDITPNTGEATNTDNHSAIEFPWWLGVVFVLGLTALGWLLWPNRKNLTKSS